MNEFIDMIVMASQAVIDAVKNRKPYSIIAYRIMSIGIVKTGVQIGDVKFWHVKKGELIRGKIIPEDGVFIQYPNATRYIKNSFYDDVNTDEL